MRYALFNDFNDLADSARYQHARHHGRHGFGMPAGHLDTAIEKLSERSLHEGGGGGVVEAGSTRSQSVSTEGDKMPADFLSC